jgi:hypothetical protein
MNNITKNRAGPGYGHARGDPHIRIKVRGDPKIVRHTRDNQIIIVLIHNELIQFRKLKGEKYG